MANAFKSTSHTWQLLANEQAYNQMQSGNLNSSTMITAYDPIYNTLMAQIIDTMYRKLRVVQMWKNLGYNATPNAYPGILREIAMRERKGENFPYDNGTKPTTLNSYRIIDDKIDVRYHMAQFRWMYGFTIYDQILRQFSGGRGVTIAQLAEMKAINGVNARNAYMDNLRKETLNKLMGNAAPHVKGPSDISSASITQADAKAFLAFIDNILFEMKVGTNLYNGLGYFMQTPINDLVMVMPRAYYYNMMRAAFPDTFSETRYMENLLPENLILIDNFGASLVDDSGNPITPEFDDNGLNLLTWTEASTVTDDNPDIMCCIMHRAAIGFEDNLDETYFAPKDIEKLATAARMHFWTSAYYTDMLPSVVVERPAQPAQPEDGGDE